MVDVDISEIGAEEDDEDIGGEAVGTKLYRKRKQRPGQLLSLAFTVPDDVPDRIVSGVSLAWTSEAMAAFSAIRNAAREVDTQHTKHFPFAYLRGAVEVSMPNVVRLEREMGLGWRALDSIGRRGAPPSAAFAFLEGKPASDLPSRMKAILNEWVVNNLIPHYATPAKVDERLTNHVETLLTSEQLLEIRPFESRAMPWMWEPHTGTTKSADKLSFQALADLAAKTLAGRELFPQLGPMRRLISASGRTNHAKLVTAPLLVGEHGELSLLVTLRVETIPSLHQPLLIMDISKRRWLTKLDEKAFDRSRITGTVFSNQFPDRAFSFWVTRRRRADGDGWEADNTFEAIRRTLDLPISSGDALAILRGGGYPTGVRSVLAYRPGIADENHVLEAGVPELDKLEGFKAAERILREIGFQPFGGFTKVRARETHYEPEGRIARPMALLGAMLEHASEVSSEGTQFTPGYLQSLNDADVDALLRNVFEIELAQVPKIAKILRGPSSSKVLAGETNVLQDLVAANRAALQEMYRDRPPTLVVFHHDSAQGRVNLQLLLGALKILWGAFPVVVNRLPDGTHGPASILDGRMMPARERCRRRIEAWRGVTDDMRRSGQRYLCLVMANLWYNDSAGGKSLRDDRVNKPSTRRALASAGAAVQFLLPPKVTQKGLVDVEDFLMRMQSAMKDLVWAHWGRVEGVRSTVETCFPDASSRPREIIGITVIRRQRGRGRSNDQSFLPVAIRLDAETGKCFLRCAYESNARTYTSSPWEHLPEALSRIAQLSPVKLAEEPRERGTRFMRFVEEVVGRAVDDKAQPVVLVDSTTASSLWPWLADSRINVDDIVVGNRQWMQQEWAGARIIRIRQGLAPSIVEDKWLELTETSASDDRSDAVTSVDASFRVTTAPGRGLLRLGQKETPGCTPYFSIGRKTLHKQKRGQSCYRAVQLPGRRMTRQDGRFVPVEPQRDGAGRVIFGLVSREACVDQWPSPNAIEFVVTLRQSCDDPDHLADFVERLRYGFAHYSEWTSLPAPLFFERVVRDYISEFDIEEADGTEGEDGEAEA